MKKIIFTLSMLLLFVAAFSQNGTEPAIANDLWSPLTYRYYKTQYFRVDSALIVSKKAIFKDSVFLRGNSYALINPDADDSTNRIASTKWVKRELGNLGLGSLWHRTGDNLSAGDSLGSNNDADLIFKRNHVLVGKLSENNTSLGLRSLQNNVGDNNLAFGDSALHYNTSGSYNVAVGSHALLDNVTGENNIGIGVDALRSNLATYNIAIGKQAMLLTTTGYDNTAIGIEALINNTVGTHNTTSGFFSMYSNTTGSWNTAHGSYALYNNATGSHNVSFGDSTSVSDPATDSSGSFGFKADAGSHQFALSPYFYEIRGDGITGANNSGYVLTTDGGGIFTFQPPGTGSNIYNANGSIGVGINRVVDVNDGGSLEFSTDNGSGIYRTYMTGAVYSLDYTGTDGSGSYFSVIGSSANIGASAAGGVIGSLLSISDLGAVFQDNYASHEGIKYYANYAADFTARSLIDKNYADSIAALASPYIAGGASLSITTKEPTNTISSTGGNSTIAAGSGNTMHGNNSFMATEQSTIEADCEAVAIVSGSTHYAANTTDTYIGGTGNSAFDTRSTFIFGLGNATSWVSGGAILGGTLNSLYGNIGTYENQNAILGGEVNTIDSSSNNSIIIGGHHNTIDTGSVNSAIIGGTANSISLGKDNVIILGMNSKNATEARTTYVDSFNVAGKIRLAGGNGTNGQVLTSSGGGVNTWTTPATGTVTSISSGYGTTFTSITSTGSIIVDTSVIVDKTGTQTLTNKTLTSPVLTTPVLGTPASGNFSSGTFTWPTFNQNTSGSAATFTSRNINGVAFNGSADITITAAAGTLTGTTLNSSVVTSSLTSVGTLSSGAVPASLITAGTFGAGAYTMVTSLTNPLLIGGTTTTSTLTLQATSGTAASGANILFKGGAAGASTWGTVNYLGNWDFGSGSLTTTGSLTVFNVLGTGSIRAAAASAFYFNGRASIYSSADAVLDFRNNANSAYASTQSLYDRWGSGSPESSVTAPVGTIYHRTDGGANTSIYVKESGSGNTGWVAK